MFGKASGFAANLDLSTPRRQQRLQAQRRGGVRRQRPLGRLGRRRQRRRLRRPDRRRPRRRSERQLLRRELRGVRQGVGLCRQPRPVERSTAATASSSAAWRRATTAAARSPRRGDVNGDGFADLIVGACRADPHGSDSGASYVVFGKASGFAANLDLSSLDGTNGFKLSGVAAGDHSGFSVASAGDVNGDGFDDLIIGALGADPNGIDSGASYVVFGKAVGLCRQPRPVEPRRQQRLQAQRRGGGRPQRPLGRLGRRRQRRRLRRPDRRRAFADPNGSDSGASYVVFGRRRTRRSTAPAPTRRRRSPAATSTTRSPASAATTRCTATAATTRSTAAPATTRCAAAPATTPMSSTIPATS